MINKIRKLNKFVDSTTKVQFELYRQELREVERKEKIISEIKRAFYELCPDLEPEDKQFVDSLFGEYEGKGDE